MDKTKEYLLKSIKSFLKNKQNETQTDQIQKRKFLKSVFSNLDFFDTNKPVVYALKQLQGLFLQPHANGLELHKAAEATGVLEGIHLSLLRVMLLNPKPDFHHLKQPPPLNKPIFIFYNF